MKIVRIRVNAVRERDGQNEATRRAQHADELFEECPRIQDMLADLARENRVERTFLERQSIARVDEIGFSLFGVRAFGIRVPVLDPDVLVHVGGEEALVGLVPATDVEEPALRISRVRGHGHVERRLLEVDELASQLEGAHVDGCRAHGRFTIASGCLR
ncbi:MAG: hypothetical protein ABSC94_24780 [Polyangiaceae bacterium]